MASYQPFAATVTRAQRLSPTFVRVTMAGESLAGFAGHGYDQRINLIFPLPGVHLGPSDTVDEWLQRWEALPPGGRPPLRTYTVRAFRPESRELDVDFVVHHDGGPAARWAMAAKPGDPIAIIGPEVGENGPIGDVAWAPPPGATRLLLAADEAALPAASAIAESFKPGDRATVVLEVPTADDVLDLDVPPSVSVTWLVRERGESLVTTVMARLADELLPTAVSTLDEIAPSEDGDPWEVPEGTTRPGSFYAWLAGESSTVVALRRYLVGQRGVDKRSVAFMGYWRRGRAQSD